MAKPSALLTNNTGCPKCNQSSGESKIDWILTGIGANFKFQYKFNDFVGEKGHRLPFDFALFDKNDKLKLVIEFDGQFHYEPTFGEEELERVQRNDKIKNEFCHYEDIPLVRIPYWEFNNLNEVLNKVLTEHDLIN